MPDSTEPTAKSPIARLRERFGERIAGIALTILLEAGLALLVLSIAQPVFAPDKEEVAIATFDTRAVSDAPDETNESEEPAANRDRPAPPQRQEQPAPEPRPRSERAASPVQVTETPIIQVAPNRMAATDIANLPRRREAPRASERAMIGPTGGAAATGDTPRVGTAPNGQPMYAATWYREPTEEELRGYLSTASGPGWALITCRTVPNYRVEDCQPISEYPQGSRMLRAVLAAAWQFRVRPPFLGGQPQVGEWVRIRVEYDIRRR